MYSDRLPRHLLCQLLLWLCLLCGGEARAARLPQSYHEWLRKPSAELLQMGNRYRDEGRLPDSAMVCYTIVADRYAPDASQEEKELCVRALNELGVFNTSYYNDHTAAYQQLLLARDIGREIGLEEMEPYILLNLGNLYNIYEFLFPSGEQGAQAGQYYEQSFRASCRQYDWPMAINSYINFVMLNMPYGVGDASVHEEMAAWLHDSIPDTTPDWQFACHFLDGNMALLHGDGTQAMKSYNLMAQALDGQGEMVREQYMVIICQAAVHLQAGRYDEAIACARQILQLESRQDLTDIHAETYRLLSEYYTALGDSLEAGRYHVAYLETKEQLMKNIVGLVPTQLSRDLQTLSDEANKMREQKRLQTINLVVALFIIVVLVAFTASISRKNRQLNEKNLALYQKMRELIRKDAPDGPKYRESQLKEEKKLWLTERIKESMNDAETICQPSFTLQTLAERLGTNTSYLSQAVNEHFGMSFTSLLNQSRVREACRRLEDQERYGHLTIDAISESVGFKARVTFTKAFKQHVGMLPSEYIKAVRQERD